MHQIMNNVFVPLTNSSHASFSDAASFNFIGEWLKQCYPDQWSHKFCEHVKKVELICSEKEMCSTACISF